MRFPFRQNRKKRALDSPHHFRVAPLPIGAKFSPQRHTHKERNSTSKKSTKHRAPDRFPRPRPSSRRRRKTSSLFLLLCVYALFFEREETARSKFVLKNSICSLSLSLREGSKRKKERKTRATKRRRRRRRKKKAKTTTTTKARNLLTTTSSTPARARARKQTNKQTKQISLSNL